MVGTEKPLFFCVLFRKRKSDFAVLASDEFNLEPLCGARPAQGHPRGSAPYPLAWELSKNHCTAIKLAALLNTPCASSSGSNLAGMQ